MPRAVARPSMGAEMMPVELWLPGFVDGNKTDRCIVIAAVTLLYPVLCFPWHIQGFLPHRGGGKIPKML